LSVIPGNSGSLWTAVKIAKDTCSESLPNTLFENGVEVKYEEAAERFASYFDSKVKDILTNTKVNDQVYNGTRKVTAKLQLKINSSWTDSQSRNACCH
jgi:hypothetical protein